LKDVPTTFLDYVAENGYDYVFVNYYVDQSSAGDWLKTPGGQTVGKYDWSETAPHNLYKSYVRLFNEAGKRKLKVIPSLGTGSRWNSDWVATNQENIVPVEKSFESRTWSMPPLAPDSAGMDRSFSSAVEVVFRAFAAAQNRYGKKLELIHIGHDEAVVGFELIAGWKPGRDRDDLLNRVASGQSWPQAYYGLIADEIFRRVEEIAKIGKAYDNPSLKAMIWADMFDPQSNGDPAQSGCARFKARAGADSLVELATAEVLKTPVMESLKKTGKLILCPWQYNTKYYCRIPAHIYDPRATLRYFAGWKCIPAMAYVDYSYADMDSSKALADSRVMMGKWLRVASRPEFSNTVIGFCVTNWWDNRGVDYWTMTPRPELFKIIPELAKKAGYKKRAAVKGK